jgi:hypothetical protein
VLAADMGAGLAAIVADGVDQGFARLDADRIVAAVDAKRDVKFFVHVDCQLAVPTRFCRSITLEKRCPTDKSPSAERGGG